MNIVYGSVIVVLKNTSKHTLNSSGLQPGVREDILRVCKIVKEN
jgi:hypothetical protein